MALASMFPGGASQGIKLDAVTDFTANSRSLEIRLNWTDPDNKYLDPDGTELATWDHTRIIRKAGSQPVSPYDGVLVVESAVKNQYQTEPYWDSGLDNGVTYYYAAYAFTTEGLVSDPAFAYATPKTYASVLEDNTWEEIAQACSEGVASTTWAKGSRKTCTLLNGESVSCEILRFSPPFTPSDALGGTPAIFFGAVDLLTNTAVFDSAANIGGSGDRYFGSRCNLRKTIEQVYEQMPQDLKKHIRQVNVEYQGADGTAYTFALDEDNVTTYYSTAAKRIKKLGYNGTTPYAWWLAAKVREEGDGYFTGAFVDSKGNRNISGDYGSPYDPDVHGNVVKLKGVHFVFCFGSNPT